MKVKYFEDTDTLYIELSNSNVIETKELNENIYVDLNSESKVVSITIEHAKEASGKLDFSYETVVGLKNGHEQTHRRQT
jgi:uncharacterized protein YuzE